MYRAVGNVYLRDPLASPGIQYFYFMGTIDYDIKLASVNLDIVADIAQLLDYVRVPFRVEVTDIITVHVIQIIQRTFIASHIPFVHQIHPLRIRPRDGYRRRPARIPRELRSRSCGRMKKRNRSGYLLYIMYIFSYLDG